jgi:hypothetical protein
METFSGRQSETIPTDIPYRLQVNKHPVFSISTPHANAKPSSCHCSECPGTLLLPISRTETPTLAVLGCKQQLNKCSDVTDRRPACASAAYCFVLQRAS